MLAALVFLATVPSCKWKAGMKCTGGAKCMDKTTALWCIEGVMQPVTCAGPQGCIEENKEVRCLQLVGETGAPCISTIGHVCSTDHQSWLECAAGRWVVKAKCGGAKGCYLREDTKLCDMSEGEPGDPCIGSGAGCSHDHTTFLLCKDGTYVAQSRCGGPLACYRTDEEKNVHCDKSIALPEDSCDEGAACTPDGTTFLHCNASAGKYEPRPCRGPRGCYRRDANVVCDESRAAEGDPCDSKGASCSLDGKKLLRCANGKRVPERPCPRGCTVDTEKKKVTCR
jgi:hypothetical protein